MKQNFRNLNGILILDKPIGLSSNQALQKVRKIFQAKKAGHTGSLDVLATGLLPICFGEATKFSQFLLDADKYYRVIGKLGERTTTCDSEGEITEKKSADHVTLEKVNSVLKQFLGESLQIPSMYSALKHQGKPLYKLARKGIEVEREPRKINIFKIKLMSFENNEMTLEVHCSKGTYIRNLIDDIGQVLECGAYVTALRRLNAGPFDSSQMVTMEMLQETRDQFLLPIDSLLQHLPSILLNEQQVQALRYGQVVQLEKGLEGLVRLIETPDNFIGVGKIDPEGTLKTKRLLQQS